MIRSLRIKFVLIVMSIVAVLLVGVVAAVYVSASSRLSAECDAALIKYLDPKGHVDPGKFSFDKRRSDEYTSVPGFSVLADANGNILGASLDGVDVSESAMEQAVLRALECGGEAGSLDDLELRFRRRQTPDGQKIAFASTVPMNDSLRSLTLTLLLAGVGALAAFFAATLLLANWALRPVERAWTAQKRFVADASHELKTPLTVILASLGLLASGDHDPKWVENARAEALRMKKLVEDLLFLAKSEDASAPVNMANFDLSQATWESLLPLESVVFEKGVTLEDSVEPNLRMRGDEAQYKQLVTILMDNAIKFTPKGGKIRVELAAQQGTAKLTVRNSGEPIPPERLEHVFERFYRADESRDAKRGGYGLGLSIAKRIVENHKGRIGAASDESGTRFTAQLPLA